MEDTSLKNSFKIRIINIRKIAKDILILHSIFNINKISNIDKILNLLKINNIKIPNIIKIPQTIQINKIKRKCNNLQKKLK